MIKIQCSNKQQIDFIYKLLNNSQEQLIFQEFYYFDTVPSTQEFANTLNSDNNTNFPFVVLSESQTGGKGRRGSNWASPKGGIWMSMVFESDLETTELFSLMILTAFIISEAIESKLGVTPQIKWPNDLLIDGKKFAGILMDTEVETDRLTKVTIGIGINSNNDLEETRKQIFDESTKKSSITSLKSVVIDGQEISNFELVSFMLYKYSKLVPRLSSKLFRDELRHLFKRKIEDSSSSLSYRFRTKNKEFAGEIVIVNDDGSILVKNLEDSLSNNLVRIDSVFDASMG
ncbi:biotin--[acetyl-CoA-carboxylase] ligase [Candidatus Nitrosocosmicus hydrocola]|uniref:biotin--[acetyl-CoA-carboxylase] ligase n=1 Tax=Candidatus Nitrosocosmicus hydrocola TaxID=1826872 RepID=UPI001372724C|nr:biotin--[acetyl-CoA-carboxylase] ligase [Candidatus Nitrosocosmicus hydrocola]